jgi:hypothetical protein
MMPAGASSETVVIFSSQISDLLCLWLERPPADLVQKWKAHVSHLDHVHWPTVGLR